MKDSIILLSSIAFLNNLETNNNREWFAENKERYIAAQSNIIGVIDQLIVLMNTMPLKMHLVKKVCIGFIMTSVLVKINCLTNLDLPLVYNELLS